VYQSPLLTATHFNLGNPTARTLAHQAVPSLFCRLTAGQTSIKLSSSFPLFLRTPTFVRCGQYTSQAPRALLHIRCDTTQSFSNKCLQVSTLHRQPPPPTSRAYPTTRLVLQVRQNPNAASACNLHACTDSPPQRWPIRTSCAYDLFLTTSPSVARFLKKNCS
jgi:hypothetical protein